MTGVHPISSQSNKQRVESRTLRLDPESDLAAVELLAFIASSETSDQRQAAATYASAMLGPATDEAADLAMRAITHPADRGTLLSRFRGLNIPVTDSALADGLAAAGARAVHDSARSIRQRIERELFVPYGGHAAVSEAPGLKKVTDQLATAMTGGAVSAALQLIVVARLHLFHSESGESGNLTASLARARRLIERMSIQVGEKFGETRAQKGHWATWAPMAPIWAGLMLAGGYPWSQEGMRLSRESIINGIFDALSSRDALKNAIAYHKWFFDFATNHVPRGAGQPIIGRAEACVIVCDEPARPPPLHALNRKELAEAQSHQQAMYTKSEMAEMGLSEPRK